VNIPFDAFFARLAKETDINTQTALADALGVNRSAITQAKTRNAVPHKWILAIARYCSLSPDWLEFGKGSPRSASVRVEEQPAADVVLIPKVSARLCAGGGSFEHGAFPVAEHPFPRAWLARMGNPSKMVFMDVVGDSMEPDIHDGDMVLVDQSVQRPIPRAILAVGLDDAIYIKRVENRGGGIRLLSDNPDYSPMELYGDELSTFRIIGKVVWLCRDCS
jgi:phage repressor protein C with HTH and peptisase S24 domain